MKTSLALACAALLHSSLSLAATPINETRPLAADARVELNNVRGLIRVVGSNRSDIQITGEIGEGAKGLIIEGDERRLSIRVDYPKSGGGWGNWWGGGDAGDSTLEVALPSGVSLQVGSVSANIEVNGVNGAELEIETVSGDVRYEGGSASIALESVSGNAEIKAVGARELDIESVSGDLRVTGKVAERIQAETVSGDLRLQLSDSSPSEVSASAVSGDIELDSALASGARVDFEVLSGDIVLSLPAASSADLRISTFSGDIRSDFGTVSKEDDGPGQRLESTLGSGDGEINIESFSGDVQVRKH